MGGSGVRTRTSVEVGSGVRVDVLVAVGWSAASRACAVAVARTLLMKDSVGVGSGRSCIYPYPPTRQEAITTKSKTAPPRVTKRLVLTRTCIEIGTSRPRVVLYHTSVPRARTEVESAWFGHYVPCSIAKDGERSSTAEHFYRWRWTAPSPKTGTTSAKGGRHGPREASLHSEWSQG
jgi:hypothetical protein